MSRLMSDLSPGTYVLNPDTKRALRSPLARHPIRRLRRRNWRALCSANVGARPASTREGVAKEPSAPRTWPGLRDAAESGQEENSPAPDWERPRVLLVRD